MTLSKYHKYDKMASESILHINGYNVGQVDNLSVSERHKILTYIIESGIMSKNDIKNHLSYLININQHSSKNATAVSRWKSDIQWANDYHSDSQNIVGLSGTALYRYRHR